MVLREGPEPTNPSLAIGTEQNNPPLKRGHLKIKGAKSQVIRTAKQYQVMYELTDTRKLGVKM